MAITILGKDPSTAKRVTCRNCGSILEYHSVDIKEYYSYDYQGGRDLHKYITCPCCNNRAHVF